MHAYIQTIVNYNPYMQIRYQKGGLFTVQQTSTSTPAYRRNMFSSAGADDMRATQNTISLSLKENKQTRKRYLI